MLVGTAMASPICPLCSSFLSADSRRPDPPPSALRVAEEPRIRPDSGEVRADPMKTRFGDGL
ncbi:hypothetical protein GCM10010387_48880 [Streptomyces inusitatus]|uniref:Uncharacterized protein n=1 Tax=Streptomyces inusitatus TaxID=68221 RepID=A0A918UZQ8_9ACTN|nr:hypothetical protein GCM10010387_48880 [Streptomyces inusitatus]